MALIVVESPTKARTFNRILKGKNFFVFATMGHLRDLPTDKLAIDYENNFKPTYQVIENKKKVVEGLVKLAKKNDEIILATDLDREGESISYHAAYLLGFIDENWPDFKIKNQDKLKRIVFHEITPQAIKEALNSPQSLRISLVKAQQTRRILDRIVGYELSPLLWRKIGKKWLSAGRVQTVALRLIVEREKEIRNFKIEEYYQIYAIFSLQNRHVELVSASKNEIMKQVQDDNSIRAKLVSYNGINYEQKFILHLFAGDYQYTKTTIDKIKAEEIKKDLLNDEFKIVEVKEEIQKRFPPPPFTTSLLQQEAFKRHGFSSRLTMSLAQDLYERGLITYHRTDSLTLSSNFLFAAKEYIEKTFGKSYSLDKPRVYKTKSKLAQEAHEAIRPTRLQRKIDDVTINHRRLYQLIFERAVATQMKEAKIKVMKIFIQSKKGYQFEAEKQQVLFDGFFRLLNPSFSKNNQLEYPWKKDDSLVLVRVEDKINQTSSPPRYNEASLIKILEEKGIGRPSTYAPIISLIQEKHYVEKFNRYFIPTKLGVTISDYLSNSFPEIFDLNFTAKMENGLDEIANNEKDMILLLREFYKPFFSQLKEKKEDNQVITVEEEIEEKCPQCQGSLVVRYSRFGKFLACTNYPQCDFTKPFLNYVAGKNCPQCGKKIVIRYTQSKKKFYGCENWPKCGWRSWRLTK